MFNEWIIADEGAGPMETSKAESKSLELMLVSCLKKQLKGYIRGLPDKSCGLQEGEQSQFTVSWQGENLARNKHPRPIPLLPTGQTQLEPRGQGSQLI